MKKRIKIAMFSEAWKPMWGGGQEVALQLSKELSKNHNYSIDLFTMNLGGKKIEKINDHFRIIRLGKKRTWCFKDRIGWFFDIQKEFNLYQKRENYTILYAHANLPGFHIKYLAKKYCLSTIFHVHGLMNILMKKSKINELIEKFIFFKLKYTLQISCSSNINGFKSVNSPIFLRNGTISFKNFKKEIKGIKKIIFASRFDYQKGGDILLKSISSIKKELFEKNIQIEFWGSGPEEIELKKLHKELGLNQIVSFKGKFQPSDVTDIFRSSDLFILPSRDEGFPLVIFEAISNKCLVLASNVGEVSSIIEDKKTGFLFNYSNDYNENALSEKLIEIIQSDSKKLNQINEEAFTLVKKNFTWKSIAKDLDKLIKEEVLK